jgi:hypothetical protein
MSPPLNKEQYNLLNRIINEDKFLFGRDKVFELIKQKYSDSKISRRQIMDFIKSNNNIDNKQKQILKKNELIEVDKIPNGTKVRVRIEGPTYSKVYYIKSSRKNKGNYFYKVYDKDSDNDIKGSYLVDDLRIDEKEVKKIKN